MKTYLFACVHNAGRSQMSAAFFNAIADSAKAKGISAGTEPGVRVHPEVVEVMKEVGIDLSDVKPQLITPKMAGDVAFLITMGCGAVCPIIPQIRREDWPLEDPKGKPIERVRQIRDDIRDRVTKFATKMECVKAGVAT
jgi:arsenate reductase (thioredoxin)